MITTTLFWNENVIDTTKNTRQTVHHITESISVNNQYNILKNVILSYVPDLKITYLTELESVNYKPKYGALKVKKNNKKKKKCHI